MLKSGQSFIEHFFQNSYKQVVLYTIFFYGKYSFKQAFV